MTIRWQPKRPTETRDYTHDWTPFLGTDTIISKVDTPTGVALSSSTILPGNQSVKFVVAGGTDGTVASIVHTITTASGNVETETFLLPIEIVEEPVSLAEAKAQLRIVDDDNEDALIASFIRSARAYVESESGYVFVQRMFVETFNYWPTYIQLGRRPIVTVESVDYTDSEGVAQTVAEADYYTSLGLRRLTPVAAWPTLGNGGAISVTYTAGFEEGEQVEELELARQAILLLVGHWYNQRETVSLGNVLVTEVPFAARALIDRFRAQVV